MEAVGLDLYKGEVGGGVGAYDGGVVGAVVVECHLKAFGALDDMVVSDDMSVGADDHSRSESHRLLLGLLFLLLGLLLLAARGAEEKFKERIVKRGALTGGALAQCHVALDADHSVDGRFGCGGEVGFERGTLRYGQEPAVGVGAAVVGEVGVGLT